MGQTLMLLAMQFRVALITCLLLISSPVFGAALELRSPGDYQVFQRSTKEKGTIHIGARLPDPKPAQLSLEARLINGKPQDWQAVPAATDDTSIAGSFDAPAGGWYRLDVRITSGGATLAENSVEHVGVGEVFIVAGQSNSANHGEEKQKTRTGLVSVRSDHGWQLANDPQPGASGKGGSFIPPLGDALAEKLKVPIGFVACGIGATSVREWLPKGSAFPNPPTLVGRVQKLPSGDWECKGDAYEMLIARMKSFGRGGFRAVLWHQGESDANQKDPQRTLSGKLYREYLEKIIRQSRKDVGWDVPWFVAQVSYHGPSDTGSPDIREAQASLWKDKIALQGPDSDALGKEFRERNGGGVHFSGAGLREHAARWAEKLIPWIEEQTTPRK
jgi:hypothetical protein